MARVIGKIDALARVRLTIHPPHAGTAQQLGGQGQQLILRLEVVMDESGRDMRLRSNVPDRDR